MSRKMLAVAAIALLAPISLAQAQLGLGFGVAAGASVVNGDFSTTHETGYHVMATAGIKPLLSPVGFRVDAMFNEFGEVEPSSDKVRIMGLNANAILGLPGAIVISPYAIGGVGMYNQKSSVAGAASSTDVGVNVGVGVKFGLAGFGAFGEIRLHNIFIDETPAAGGGTTSRRFIPVSFGIMF